MKFLIPIDGSANANRALDYVINNAAELREPAQIYLLNVQWKLAMGNVKLFISQATMDDYYREQGLAQLAAARAKLDSAQCAYEYHISVGAPAAAIVQYADAHQIEQIVMCKQGQTGLQSMLLGSVTSQVVQLTNCPILVLP
jgi:nucleotide-binding universal stress UspA family protein